MALFNLFSSDASPLTECFMIMAAFAILAVAGTLIFHRFIPHRSLKVHNDIAGPIFSTLGVVYAVLLGFVVVAVWQNFDRAKLNAEMEVNCLANLYVDSRSFEPSFKQNITSDLSAYTSALIDEWDMLANGKHNPEARKAIEKLIKLYGDYSPRNEAEKVFFAESVAEVNKLLDLRISRITNARSGVHPLLWFVLIFGGIITIVFTIFFGTDNLRAKLVMTTLLAMLIALVLFTILEFSLPYTGFASVSCDSFKLFLARIIA